MNTREYLENLSQRVRNQFERDRNVMSFGEYLQLVNLNPRHQLRNAAQYLVDVFEYFGSESVRTPAGAQTRFRLFDGEFDGGLARVAGQERIIAEIHKTLSSFAMDGRINKLILLHGPNGSAKTSIIAAIGHAMEQYSRQPEGAQYRFSWIFPNEKLTRSSIGFGAGPREGGVVDGDSFAYLPPEDIESRIVNELSDHPLLLIPKEERQGLLDSVSKNAKLPWRISAYLRHGDLSAQSRRIYEALMIAYRGDFWRVMRHVQVERFYTSRRYRTGAATVEPQMSVDADVRQITMDKSYGSLPPMLQNLNLHVVYGPLVDANRGLLEYNDLLKRPLEAFKYLLSTCESGTVGIGPINIFLDTVFIGSTNEKHLDAFKEHPDFQSFKGRIQLVRAPYLLRVSDEQRIYQQRITRESVHKTIAPHAHEVAALWAVLTRLKRPELDNPKEGVRQAVRELTPLEKARLYDEGVAPSRLNSAVARELTALIPDLINESANFPYYEGRFGASPREIQTALLAAAHHPEFKTLHPLAVLEELKKLIADVTVYDWLQLEPRGDYHRPAAFLTVVEDAWMQWVDREFSDAMGLAEERNYLDYINRYVRQVTHWVRGERVQDPVSGQFVEPDEQLMREFEKTIGADNEKPQDFRNNLIGAIGAYSLEHPGEPVDYERIFHRYIERLKETFFERKKKDIRKTNEEFQIYLSPDRQRLDNKTQDRMKEMMDRLASRYGYDEDSARETLAFLIRKRYGDTP
ncbi:MAG: hypothetical protein GMKNLPBB_00176 [Myxococcota bacterium]|nr:hypothetical protein [Myxococcota bacterium]